MTVIKVKPNDPIRDLNVLMRYVLKYIYVATNKWNDRNLSPDKERMSIEEIHLMEHSIQWWAEVELIRLQENVERKIILFKTTADQIDQDEMLFVKEKVQMLGWMLHKNAMGYFDARKEEFYFKSIDWKKFHRLEEAYTEEDFARGADALAEFNRKNPELAG